MNKLKKNEQFQNIYKTGIKAFGYYSLVYIKTNKKNSDNEVGFVVSKKTGNAVCRNRLKRLFREYYRLNEEKLKKSYDIVFIAKRTAGVKVKTLKYYEMEKDLNLIFKKLKMFV
ncbi:ribonuclease P protein component [uncultured Ilyobacter sp.]|uniref:ribonuclease P protein component n=1 Tax=uncultured Ilyobacter sp. TaxID=544433 RepID=UPI002AA64FA2|nr:ribonuclease P protein component [uncultured Ilyobacter sp.]